MIQEYMFYKDQHYFIMSQRKIRINSLNSEDQELIGSMPIPSFSQISRTKTQVAQQTMRISKILNRNKSGWIKKSKLSPIRQYQTKLKLSSESWTILDYRKGNGGNGELKRGWKPKECGDFTGLLRLVMLQTWIQIVSSREQYSEISFQVKALFLKQEIEIMKQKKLPPQKRKPLVVRDAMKKCVDNGTSIKILDMLYGVFMTDNADLFQYLQIALGYLAYYQHNQINALDQLDGEPISLTNYKQAISFQDEFIKYVNEQILTRLQMFDSKAYNPFDFQSTAEDICKLYLQIEKEELFHDMVRCCERVCRIRYRVGFKYWESRTIKFKNEDKKLSENHEVVFCWRGKKYFSVISRNKQLDTLLVLRDCKFGMQFIDIRVVEQWLKGLRKPICNRHKSEKKMLPLIKISSECPSIRKRTLISSKILG